jgi:poly-gamma-glutamate synthesis protein (capsule biosynthesis protein)
MGSQSRAAMTALRAAFAADTSLEILVGAASVERRTAIPASGAPALTFPDACRAGPRFTLTAVGDLLLHSTLQSDARAAGTFQPFLSAVRSELSRPHSLAIANLETGMAEGLTLGTRVEGRRRVAERITTSSLYDGVAYTGYPRFNAHPLWADAIVASGIDIVTTANNHALDRGSNGVDATLDVLDAVGLAHAGTSRYVEGRAVMPAEDRYTIREIDGVRVAVVAATFSTNGIPDTYGQVALLSERQAVEDVRALRVSGRADVIVFAPHWGVEYAHRPSAEQTRIAHAVLEAGADAVFGSHPHVLQPLERYHTLDGRETLVAYSLGNFVAGQVGSARRESAILHLTFTRPEGGGRPVISAAQFVPTQIAVRFSPEADGMIDLPILIETQGGDPAARTNVINALGNSENVVAPGAALGAVCSDGSS